MTPSASPVGRRTRANAYAVRKNLSAFSGFRGARLLR